MGQQQYLLFQLIVVLKSKVSSGEDGGERTLPVASESELELLVSCRCKSLISSKFDWMDSFSLELNFEIKQNLHQVFVAPHLLES